MLVSLALIPSIVLMVYIYKKDKREKEPFGLLMGCFVFGALIVFPVIVMETLLEDYIFANFVTEGSVAYGIVSGFLVAALSEELFKYLALKLKTWKSKEYNCTFDGIVYAVFVSLGFATFENVMYVLDGGMSTAILRMFTAVPGHACDAVFMGYFYSLAKKAQVSGDKKGMRKNKRRALLVPIIMHGLYDCFISFEEEVAGENVVLIGILLWIVIVIAEFVMAFAIVTIASKKDTLLCPYEENDESRLVFAMKKGNWVCSCNNINAANFCPVCGAERPDGAVYAGAEESSE